MTTETAPTVALSTEIDPFATQMFEARGAKVVTFDKSMPLGELAVFVTASNAVMLGKRSNPKLTGDFLKQAKSLHAIGCYCKETGIDLAAADAEGVTVFNSPEGNSDAVAEYVITMAQNLSRGFITGDHMAQRGVWGKKVGEEIEGQTLALWGYGAVGKRAAKKAHALGMRVIFWDQDTAVQSDEYAERTTGTTDLLREADVLSVHIPGKGNEGLIDAEAIAVMKDGAKLINSARYEITDVEAVKIALLSEKLGGFALDVHAFPEPSKFGDEFKSVFQGIDNAIITCHQAGSGKNAQKGTTVEVTDYLDDHWMTGNTERSLNMPPIELADVDYGTRLILPHSNKSGVVNAVAGVLTAAGINIEDMLNKPKHKGQPGTLVYAHYDTDGADFNIETFDKIKALPFALRPRIIRASKDSK